MDKQTVRETAREMAREIGLINITRDDLCRRAGIPAGSFQRVMGGDSFSSLIESLQSDTSGENVDIIRKRTVPALREAYILASAVGLAIRDGYNNITRADVAAAAGVSGALVTLYFNSMDELRAAIMASAIKKDIPRLIAQGLANNDPVALSASDALKRRAAKTLIDS